MSIYSGGCGTKALFQLGTTATPNDVVTQMAKGVTVYDAYGQKISPLMDNVIDIGNHTLDFDMDTLQGRITPAFATEAMAINDFGGALFSYTGSDCRAMIEVADTGGLPRFSKQLLELT